MNLIIYNILRNTCMYICIIKYLINLPKSNYNSEPASDSDDENN